MSKIEDGGPTYPLCVPVEFQFANTGMSLRDKFAIAALGAGDLFDARGWHHPASMDKFRAEAERIAICCYAIADAMIAARKGGSDGE